MDKKEAGVEEVAQGAPLETEVEVSDSGASAESEDSTDYKALYEKEVTEKENYKNALTQKRQLLNKPEVEETEEEDEDKPLTRKDLQNILTPALAATKVDSALESITDPEKRKLVKFYYENRIRQTGTSDVAIKQDIDAALAIVDAPRLRKVSSELTRKNNMQITPQMSGSNADRGVDKKNHQFSEAQIKALTETARRLGADPQKFIEQTWKNQARG